MKVLPTAVALAFALSLAAPAASGREPAPVPLTPYYGTGFKMQCSEAFFGMSRSALGLAEGDKR